ncbi:hypothetical protein [Microcystis sp. M_OC_Ca_00000000_C217Col]|nr:hypothetical protein [Microcystis sp. M_OC_Ca_00000000_C217Col]
MKTQGFEARFSQNLAPVGARNLCTKNSEPVLLEAKRTNQANLIKLFIF